jgi:hypothetical protein
LPRCCLSWQPSQWSMLASHGERAAGVSPCHRQSMEC